MCVTSLLCDPRADLCPFYSFIYFWESASSCGSKRLCKTMISCYNNMKFLFSFCWLTSFGHDMACHSAAWLSLWSHWLSRHKLHWRHPVRDGLVLTSFSHSLNRMYFTHTLVFGFGVCFIYNCSYLVIAQNFKENLSMATGIVALGASVGVLFTGPLLQVLLDSFGWRGSYRVVAACFTLVCILSLTYNLNVQKK